jgi:hypothetical protein
LKYRLQAEFATKADRARLTIHSAIFKFLRRLQWARERLSQSSRVLSCMQPCLDQEASEDLLDGEEDEDSSSSLSRKRSHSELGVKEENRSLAIWTSPNPLAITHSPAQPSALADAAVVPRDAASTQPFYLLSNDYHGTTPGPA